MAAFSHNPAVLIYEDQVDILIILHRLFRDLVDGYDILTTSTAPEALAQIFARDVKLALIGYVPKSGDQMNGLQLVQLIKEASPSTYIIFDSMYLTPQLTEQAKQAGADVCLQQPFPLDRLETYIHHGLQEIAQRPSSIPLSESEKLSAQKVYQYLKDEYERAGMPHGDYAIGIERWVRERLR